MVEPIPHTSGPEDTLTIGASPVQFFCDNPDGEPRDGPATVGDGVGRAEGDRDERAPERRPGG